MTHNDTLCSSPAARSKMDSGQWAHTHTAQTGGVLTPPTGESAFAKMLCWFGGVRYDFTHLKAEQGMPCASVSAFCSQSVGSVGRSVGSVGSLKCRKFS